MSLLPEADDLHLRTIGLQYDATVEGGFLCVVVKDYPLRRCG